MMSIEELAQSTSICLVEAHDENTTSQIWFKTEPLDRLFCYRAVQLQLHTDSCDQGHVEDVIPGSWSWFEVVILENAQAAEPRIEDGKELAWRSHGNRTDPDDTKDSIARHFGMVFDRRHELLDSVEPGNVIAVRVCARYPGWLNDARTGRLIAKVLDEDIFSPMSWTLTSRLTPNDIPDTIENGLYTLISTEECTVEAKDSNLVSRIWFSTPELDDHIVSKIEDIQLFTRGRNQGLISHEVDGIWSWFDLVILPSSDASEPKTKDGRALVWRSHDNNVTSTEDAEEPGKLFNLQHEIFSFLEPGNVIAVRVCARFLGWENHAHDGRLVVRISNKGPRRPPVKPTADWKGVLRSIKQLQDSLREYLNDVTPEGVAAALSVETALLTQELRIDGDHGAQARPLRLLSLDGGGVRGISSLHVIKAVMAKITGDPNAKPCEYFDMMAGTSTGGLIAIMLGRLKMTVDQCIDAYNTLAQKIFDAGILSQVGNGASTGARYSEKVLEQAVKDIVKKYTGDEDAPMRDPEDGCKVFVLACRADDLSNRVATHLRTYTNPKVEKSFADYKIWEAARATSAAPTYFPRMKLGEYEYVDGGVGFNNPVLLLMGEARLFYGFASPFGCLLTVGTGMEPNVELPPDGTDVASNISGAAGVVQSMWDLATKGEHANKMAEPLLELGTYYRFNVGVKIAEKHWVEKVDPVFFQRWFGSQPQVVEHFTAENWTKITIDLGDWKNMPGFVKLTQSYLETEEQKVKECAVRLPPRRGLAV